MARGGRLGLVALLQDLDDPPQRVQVLLSHLGVGVGQAAERPGGDEVEHLLDVAFVGRVDADGVGAPWRTLGCAVGLPTKKDRLGPVRDLRDSVRAVPALLEPPGAGLALIAPVWQG